MLWLEFNDLDNSKIAVVSIPNGCVTAEFGGKLVLRSQAIPIKVIFSGKSEPAICIRADGTPMPRTKSKALRDVIRGGRPNILGDAFYSQHNAIHAHLTITHVIL